MARKKKVARGRKPGQAAVGIESLMAAVYKHHKAGGSMSSIARELGVTPAAISLRLKYLRDNGVKVPEFARGRGKASISSTIATAKALAKKYAKA